MAKARPSALKAPFLKRISIVAERFDPAVYPFNLPCLRGGDFELTLDRRVLILVGENGTGKSTILEAIGRQCGFNVSGGNRNHAYDGEQDEAPLADAFRLSWLPRMTTGFYMRAESFFNFATYLASVIPEGSDLLEQYGGKPLHKQSHGESFLGLFQNKFSRRGIYILDEPEAALSPQRQFAFLRVLDELEATGEQQFVMATHSPILMSYPKAQVVELDDTGAHEVDYRETAHFRLMRDFLNAPDRYLARLFADEPSDQAER